MSSTARPTSAKAATAALFFGLSEPANTLSADPNRVWIGDDEHGWSDEASFKL